MLRRGRRVACLGGILDPRPRNSTVARDCGHSCEESKVIARHPRALHACTLISNISTQLPWSTRVLDVNGHPCCTLVELQRDAALAMDL